MLFSIVAQLEKRSDAELIVLPFWEKGGHAKPAASCKEFADAFKAPIHAKDFSGKEGECVLLYGGNEGRILLVGLGSEEKQDVDLLRRVYGGVARQCSKKKIKKINLVLPNIVELRKISVEECLQGICEGLLLANYSWSQKSKKENTLLEHVSLIGVLPKMLPFVEGIVQVAEGIYLARDLINGNADEVTPIYLAQVAKNISLKFPQIKTSVLNKKEIEKEKMGLLLAVARGSSEGGGHDPTFITMSYNGAARSKDHTVLVGKGVTFDTGGLNLKPTSSMETMRDDMSGGALILGALAAAAALKLKVNVTGVIPCAENAIDATSFKPGDVYHSHSGKTVEIKDTDAEGRLLLADALSYTVKNLKPTRIIDFATLTGSIVVALGESISGLMANDDELANQLLDAGKRSNEPLWRMPLYQPYKENLKSDIADLKNTGGRPAGALTAALFLEEFVSNVAWAHIDIAGTAFSSKENGYLPKNGIGVGVRLVIDFLKHLQK